MLGGWLPLQSQGRQDLGLQNVSHSVWLVGWRGKTRPAVSALSRSPDPRFPQEGPASQHPSSLITFTTLYLNLPISLSPIPATPISPQRFSTSFLSTCLSSILTFIWHWFFVFLTHGRWWKRASFRPDVARFTLVRTSAKSWSGRWCWITVHPRLYYCCNTLDIVQIGQISP